MASGNDEEAALRRATRGFVESAIDSRLPVDSAIGVHRGSAKRS